MLTHRASNPISDKLRKELVSDMLSALDAQQTSRRRRRPRCAMAHVQRSAHGAPRRVLMVSFGGFLFENSRGDGIVPEGVQKAVCDGLWNVRWLEVGKKKPKRVPGFVLNISFSSSRDYFKHSLFGVL